MLNELKEIHAELTAALDELDRLTSADAPDETRVASARVQLGRVSGRRRRLVDAVITALLDSASPDDARRLRALREQNAAQLESSTQHIGNWGLRDLVADWPGYCRAASTMRQSLRDLVAADRDILYPQLARASL